MASSYFRECGNLPAKAANSLSQVVASTHLPAHRENVLHYWPQAASLATGNLRVLLVPRSHNRESHSFPIQVLYLLCSKAWPQLNRAWRYVLALLHLDQRDALAIHQASIEALLSHFQVFEQALFFLNMEAQPSNEELPHLILPKFTYKPPNDDITCRAFLLRALLTAEPTTCKTRRFPACVARSSACGVRFRLFVFENRISQGS